MFISLLVSCYFLYMDEAIKKSKMKATTVTKRSEEYQFETPSITICPEPGFKPSVTQKYNLSLPTRHIFFEDMESDTLQSKQSVQGIH